MILRSGWLLRPDEPPVRQAELRIDAAGRVARVGRAEGGAGWRDDGQELVDFGPQAIIIPGLVNAHTHLELSHVAATVPAGETFGEWLGRIISLYRGNSDEVRAEAVARGAALSLAAGVTCVADISYAGAGWENLLASPLRSTRFVEVFGHRVREIGRRIKDDLATLRRLNLLPHEMASPSAGAASDSGRVASPDARAASQKGRVASPWSDGAAGAKVCSSSLAAAANAAADHRGGLSPHAPYSAGVRAYVAARRAAEAHHLPLATHLHETSDEIELYRTGRGALRRAEPMKSQLASARFRPSGRSPIATLDAAGFFAAPVLVAHGNYLDEGDIEILRRSGSSVVYCPRSHAHFGHERHPVDRLLAAGVNVALGTDSLASSPSLSVLDELRFLRSTRSDLSPQVLLKMATVNGAVAVGRGGVTGRLAVGEWADLVVVNVCGHGHASVAMPPDARHGSGPAASAAMPPVVDDPWRGLLDKAGAVAAVMVGGRRVK